MDKGHSNVKMTIFHKEMNRSLEIYMEKMKRETVN